MSGGWVDDVPTNAAIGLGGWFRVLLRGAVLGFLTFGCLGLLLLIRVIERPIFGQARPITPHITAVF